MSHARQQIREAVAAAVTGLATTGTNVFVNKITPQEAESLPNLLVYTDGESSEADAMGASRGLMRALDVVIDATAEGEGIDDTLDTIAAEVEVAIAGDAALAALVKDITLTSTAVSRSAAGQTPMMGLRLTFSAQYRTRRGVPGTSI